MACSQVCLPAGLQSNSVTVIASSASHFVTTTLSNRFKRQPNLRKRPARRVIRAFRRTKEFVLWCGGDAVTAATALRFRSGVVGTSCEHLRDGEEKAEAGGRDCTWSASDRHSRSHFPLLNERLPVVCSGRDGGRARSDAELPTLKER